MKELRIIFTIVCAVCIALLFPLGMIVGWAAAGICLLGAFLSFGLMTLCKQKQEEQEEKSSPSQPSTEEDTQKEE